MANTPKATRKKTIVPTKITLVVEASRINENGTFSSFNVVSVKGPNSSMKAVAPPQGGGSIYLQTTSMDNLDILPEDSDGKAEKTKLF